MFNTTPVYKAAGGWVKQLNDGYILGPFETEQIAKSAIDTRIKGPEVKKTSEKEVNAKA